MKVQDQNKKKNLFKQLFIKFARFLGYEIIDQSNLTIPTQNKSISENLNKPGISSITMPLGKVNITRKISELTIILRCCTSYKNKKSQVLLDQNKNRIFEFPKSEYTLRTINSLICSCNDALKEFSSLNIKLIVTDHNSEIEIIQKIEACLKKANFKTSIINLDGTKFNDVINKKDELNNPISDSMFSNFMNTYNSLLLSRNEAKDLVYLLEDDYIHKREAIKEMLFAYERIATQLNKEIFLCPADYPYLYTKIEYSKIFVGSKTHWRTVNETLFTFMTSKQMILKYWNELKSMTTLRYHPAEKILHEIYEKEYCLSPIPSLAMHCTNVNSIYGLPPNLDWKKIWEENKDY